MAILLTHVDDDGKCAGAIALRHLFYDYMGFPPKIVYYNYEHQPIVEDYEFTKDETVIITDLYADEYVKDFMRRAIAAEANVTHIDHHRSTIEGLKNLSDEDARLFNSIKHFYSVEYSATMLIWVYAHLSEEQRVIADEMLVNHEIEFNDTMTRFEFNIGTINEKIINIPMCVREIDRWDIHRGMTEETKKFHLGFMHPKFPSKPSIIFPDLDDPKDPYRDMWTELFENPNESLLCQKLFIEPGEKMLEYNYWRYSQDLPKGYVIEIDGKKVFAINYRDVEILDKVLDQYDFCIAYYYNGNEEKWHHHLRSGNNGENVADFAQKHGGGGHLHAAGFITKELLSNLRK